jgi:hypothetical protein
MTRIEDLNVQLLTAIELVNMQDRLLACYRIGTRPSGATLDKIRQLRAELERLRGEGKKEG